MADEETTTETTETQETPPAPPTPLVVEKKEEVAEAPKKPWDTDRKPNIQFVGKQRYHENGEVKFRIAPDSDVPLEVKSGLDTIELPPAEIQKQGFFHPRAGFLRRNYGSLYKKPVNKGGEVNE